MIQQELEFKERVEAKRKDLETKLASLKEDATETAKEKAEEIERDLDAYRRLLMKGWKNLSQENLESLKHWIKGP